MPLLRDYIDGAIKSLEKIVNDVEESWEESDIDDEDDEDFGEMVLKTDHFDDVESLTDEAVENLEEYSRQQIDVNKVVGFIQEINDSEDLSLMKSKADKAIDMIYEMIGELRPVSDPNQLEISFDGK